MNPKPFDSINRPWLRAICILFLLQLVFLSAYPQRGQAVAARSKETRKIRVACVGNSITYGGGLKDKATEAYPAVLQQLLGERYEVGNFGKNGATLIKKAPNPYVATDEFREAQAFHPDIVIIDLGINDTGLQVWPFFRDDFTADYLDLIDSFRKLDSKPVVWVCSMTPYFNRSKRFVSALRDWYWEVQDDIRLVSESAGTGLIDLHTPLYSMPHLFSDGVHPDKDGARMMARTIYGVISGDHGGLTVAGVFGAHMVLQRNKPIPVWGKANSGEEVSVAFAGQTLKAKADQRGDWKVIFHSRKEGGPFEMKVRAGRKEVNFDDILIGDVWLCSGQSNMTFRLRDASTAEADVPSANDGRIRLFNMKTADSTIKGAWDSVLLERINHLEYDTEGWQRCTPENASPFSAVAYYFGKKVASELNVPIGLVHNSKGGSPAEAWVDRHTLEFNPLLADLLQDWKASPLIGRWCRERGKENTGEAKNPLQRHPYEPAYLFESCMKPWTAFPIKGIVWYQGEANVHNIALHEEIFTSMIDCWRGYWGQDLPVYFAQLSSFHSPAWGHFRDSQRRLMAKIPNTGMAITTDVGDSLDIHPKRKKQVGERLALWALAKEYGYEGEYSGPLFERAYTQGGRVVVTFTHAAGLHTVDGKSVRSFEVAGADKVFRPVKATIENDRIVLQTPGNFTPAFVRFGWRPYSDANLINSDNLPASTFSSGLQPKQ